MGFYYKELSTYNKVSKEEEVELFKKAQECPEAYEAFIQNNLRLAVKLAAKYKGQGLSFDDLVQEANVGLIKAFNSFDVEKGCKFSTHATWQIKQALSRSLADKGKVIKTPAYLYELISKIKKLQDERTKLGEEPYTEEQLAKMLEVPLKRVKNAMSITTTASLDIKIGEDEESTLGDLVASDTDLEEEYYAKELSDALSQELDKLLTAREKEVVIRRYGTTNNKPETLEQIGDSLKLTKERIRQVEKEALKKLKRSKSLFGLL